MKVFTLNGEIGVRSEEVDDCAVCSQVVVNHTAPHQKSWWVERRNAPIRSALRRAGSQVIKEALCISCATVLGLALLMRNVLVSINNHTPYQALLDRRPQLVPLLEGGYHGDLDTNGQNDLARVRETVAITIVEVTAKQGFARGGNVTRPHLWIDSSKKP